MLQLTNVLCDGATVTLFHIEAHTFSFIKGFESVHVYRGEMDKYVRAVFLANKSISLLITEPFYNSLCQNTDLLSMTFFIGPTRRTATPA